MDRDSPRSHPSYRWRYGKKGSYRAPSLAPVVVSRGLGRLILPPPRPIDVVHNDYSANPVDFTFSQEYNKVKKST